MTGDSVIRVEGLGKKYLLSHQSRQQKSGVFRHLLAGDAGGAWRAARGGRARRGEAARQIDELWALKDAEFEVKRGEVVGIIGRNGAGKSTLLKILSRITEPTEGRVEIHGRVASLLEVGTGFHPELTGRENIFLNGAVLGMSRSEIRRKFDEIVAFAEIERFLDTPVKRYSSGMYVRLAFAVAAQLDTEVLIADEVLAVGDVEFQRKSLGKMHEAAEHGRTVLFVSHNMSSIEKLCTRGLLLEDGGVRVDGTTREVISRYLGSSETAVLSHIPISDRTRVAEVVRITLCDRNGRPLNEITVADTLALRIEAIVRERHPELRIAFSLHDALGVPIFASSPADDGAPQPTELGSHEFFVVFPGPLLLPRRYFINVSLYTERGQSIQHCESALVFDVLAAASHVYSAEPTRVGLLQIQCGWTHRRREPARDARDEMVAGRTPL